ncbi:glycosyl hydrolase family 65 protein [Mesomycoplasma lagogenitalium]|uniref:Glycosyl hydrolase family 65 protein n=1 Tax=Mesomycoplasma lagogenitalium TaxID=171286 RepID=A0ABY8LWR5_9BACT|nr:glycosyl hydrolase family 65 protein [Mesomycoplasma lagogenitalium]WGI36753.1 glycosyl hydrolase family 65 protein [Mesomycoplasma lagogenitalium]
MPKLIYDTKNFIIEQRGFNSLLTKKSESIFSQGNGYLGLRATDEEKNVYNKEDFFVNGIFNRGDRTEVSELANLADLLKTSIFIDDEIFMLNRRMKYRKSLDLKNGILKREVEAKIKNKKFLFVFKRIVSQTNKQIYAQTIEIKQLTGEKTCIKIFPMIDGQTTNSGIQHLDEGKKTLLSESLLQYQEQTNQSNHWVIHNLKLRAYANNKILKSGNDDYVLKMARRQVGYLIKSEVSVNKPFKLEKIMSVSTSVDNDEILNYDNVKENADKLAKTIEEIKFKDIEKQNKIDYDKIYKQFDVKIEGNKEAKYDLLALKFSIYHMNNFVPTHSSNMSVGAKGLSGEGYQGHCYWDTEFFIVPNYLFTNPKIARNLLEYRYKGIEGAREKAAEGNYIGAQYPWEMAWPTDGEVTPYWGQPDIVTGKQIPIASRKQEIHVPGDIAFAVDQYFQVTNDQDFMNKMGYEMIIDTAIFWTSRVEKMANNKYQITDVMGPNEYKGNIDNNNFINLVAKRNLELAIDYINKLSSNSEGLKILDDINKKLPYKWNLNLMIDVKDNLIQQLPNENNIIAENDQFLSLPRMDISDFQLLGDAGKKLFNTKEGHKRLGAQLVKQADVILSTFIFNELFSREVVRANFDFYEPVTTHDSSLSPTTYSIKAIDLRKMDIAYKLFKYSLNIDMGTNFHSADAGIHAGSLAAIWQSVVFGYGGFRFLNKNVYISPILPNQWTKLTYSITVKNTKLKVSVNKNDFTIEKVSGNDLKVYVNEQEYLISNKHNFKVITKW